MKDESSLIFSRYIIDGVPMEETPFSALLDVLDGNGSVPAPSGPFEDIVDNSTDKLPFSLDFKESRSREYIREILSSSFQRRAVDLRYPVFWTRRAINALLLDLLFKDGHFTLDKVLLMAKWDWKCSGEGNMAAFYKSTTSMGEYLFDLGIKLDRYFIETNRKGCFFEVEARNKTSNSRKCPATMRPDSSSWVIYVPFDNSRLLLGGSALSIVAGNGSGAEAETCDPDYFIDCYEVIREMVEDSIIQAGMPVGRGGLAVTSELFRGKTAFRMDIGGILSSTGESDPIRVLFAECPGVLVQIADSDFDYFDSQMLLQETAYFPLGHPGESPGELEICRSAKGNVADIVGSLLCRASEGED